MCRPTRPTAGLRGRLRRRGGVPVPDMHHDDDGGSSTADVRRPGIVECFGVCVDLLTDPRQLRLLWRGLPERAMRYREVRPGRWASAGGSGLSHGPGGLRRRLHRRRLRPGQLRVLRQRLRGGPAVPLGGCIGGIDQVCDLGHGAVLARSTRGGGSISFATHAARQPGHAGGHHHRPRTFDRWLRRPRGRRGVGLALLAAGLLGGVLTGRWVAPPPPVR